MLFSGQRSLIYITFLRQRLSKFGHHRFSSRNTSLVPSKTTLSRSLNNSTVLDRITKKRSTFNLSSCALTVESTCVEYDEPSKTHVRISVNSSNPTDVLLYGRHQHPVTILRSRQTEDLLQHPLKIQPSARRKNTKHSLPRVVFLLSLPIGFLSKKWSNPHVGNSDSVG